MKGARDCGRVSTLIDNTSIVHSSKTLVLCIERDTTRTRGGFFSDCNFGDYRKYP